MQNAPQQTSAAFGVTDLWLLLTALIWGTNYAVTKFALEDFLPLAFSGPRFLIASLCMAAVLYVSRQGFTVERRHWLPMFLFGVSSVALNQALFTIGLSYTRAGNAALILSTSPIFTAIISRFRHHEHFSRRGILGLLIGFAGITLIILSGNKEVNFRESLTGDLLLLLAAVFWATYTVGTGQFAPLYGSLKSATIMMLLGTPVLLLFSAPTLVQQNWAAVRAISWAGMVASGVLSLALCFILWNYGVKRIGATRTAIYSNVQPIVALLAAWLMIGEVPSAGQICGAVITFVGVYMVRRGMTSLVQNHRQEDEEEEISLGLSKG
ncbi:MAG: DMT family transporter [Acidobacteria bacterium]|nr:DMT family transporter [Acidobacteriota bacterium]